MKRLIVIPGLSTVLLPTALIALAAASVAGAVPGGRLPTHFCPPLC